MAKKYPLGNYGLSIVLGLLFVTSWGAQTYFGWEKYSAEQAAHQQKPTVLGQDGYIHEWGQATFENWQSEFLQLLAFVILTALFVHKGSHESKDEDDERRSQLDRIESQLQEIVQRLEKGTASKASLK